MQNNWQLSFAGITTKASTIMATIVFDIETSALPLENYDEAQQEYCSARLKDCR